MKYSGLKTIKRIIFNVMLSVICITITGCSHEHNITKLNHQGNGTFTRLPFTDERTGDEGSSGVTVTTIQDLGSGDFAQIHWLLLTSGTTLSYSGVSVSKPIYKSENATVPRYSTAYGEIFSGHSGHNFYYSENGGNADIAISIFKLNKNQIPYSILSGICEQFDLGDENNAKSGIHFGYKPTKSYRETLEYLQEGKLEKVNANILTILEDPKYNITDTMHPCGSNTFQVIGDYIVAGGFGWKDGGGARGGWLHNIEIIKQ